MLDKQQHPLESSSYIPQRHLHRTFDSILSMTTTPMLATFPLLHPPPSPHALRFHCKSRRQV